MSATSLDGALGSANRVLVDTSSFIAYHSPPESAYDLARHLFRRVASHDDPFNACYSVVSAAELLVRPIRAGTERSRLMTSWLRDFPHLHALDVTLDVARQAATLHAMSGLKTPDALIVASGMLAGCEAIITNDKRWRDRLQPLFPEFRWVYLHDHL